MSRLRAFAPSTFRSWLVFPDGFMEKNFPRGQLKSPPSSLRSWFLLDQVFFFLLTTFLLLLRTCFSFMSFQCFCIFSNHFRLLLCTHSALPRLLNRNPHRNPCCPVAAALYESLHADVRLHSQSELSGGCNNVADTTWPPFCCSATRWLVLMHVSVRRLFPSTLPLYSQRSLFDEG